MVRTVSFRHLSLGRGPQVCSARWYNTNQQNLITTGYGLDGPGIEYRWARDFPHLSRVGLTDMF